MTYLTLLATIYLVVGTTSLLYISIRKIGRRGWPLPVLCLRWDKHGLVDVVIGTTYASADYLWHIGMLAH